VLRCIYSRLKLVQSPSLPKCRDSKETPSFNNSFILPNDGDGHHRSKERSASALLLDAITGGSVIHVRRTINTLTREATPHCLSFNDAVRDLDAAKSQADISFHLAYKKGLRLDSKESEDFDIYKDNVTAMHLFEHSD
jgi:hypothetical protein